MPTYTIEVNQLDTITKHLIEINQQLAIIKNNTTENDNTLKWATLAITCLGIIVGLLIFHLTRSKEIKFKKTDISGEIHANVYELQHIYFMSTFFNIDSRGYYRIIKLRGDVEYMRDFVHPDDQGDLSDADYLSRFNQAHDELDKYNLKSVELHRNLRKNIGQYRLYLSENKRKKLDELIDPVGKMSGITYDFSDLKNIRECEERITSLRKSHPKDFRDKYDKSVKAVYDFLDNNI